MYYKPLINMKMIFRYFGEKTRKSNNLLLDNAVQYHFLQV